MAPKVFSLQTMHFFIQNSARLLLFLLLVSATLVLTPALAQVQPLAPTQAQAQAAQIEWPTAPSRLSLATPFGTLSVRDSDYVYDSTLLFRGQPVVPAIKGIINITYAFSLPKTQAALVSINNGSYQCPYVYRWVLIDKSGYQVSPKFGSCSDKIKVSATGHRFTMHTPNAENSNKIDVYVYDGKTVKHRTQP